MNRTGSMLVLATLTSAALATAASAQLPGIPYGPVETGLGLNVSADYGKPNDEAGGGSAYGLTAGLGFSRFGLSASVGGIKPEGYAGGTEIGIAGRLGMKLLGGGLNPLTIGAQLGVSSVSFESAIPGESVRLTTIMPAAWVRISPPLFPLKPWGQVYYVTGSDIEEEVRFAVGANFNLLLGLGVHAGYDFGDGGSALGVGVHFTFRVPGLGVPGVPGM
jgi:hypothetical protein